MITGKVFDSSVDIYQDQAKVLFDFYLNAAQKIVEQEDACDQKLAELNNNILRVNERSKNVKTNTILGFALIGVGLFLLLLLVVLLFLAPEPIILFLLFIGAIVFAIPGTVFLYKAYNAKDIAEKETRRIEQQKQQCINARNAIFRDYKIHKVGVVYVPVAKKVAFGDKSVVVDLTESVPNTTISLQVANNPNALVQTLKDLEKLSTEAPIVEKSEQVEQVETSDFSSSIQDIKFYDYFGMMDRTLRTGAYYLSDVSTKDIKVPFVHPGSPQMNFLDRYSTTEVGNEVVVPVFSKNRFDKEMEDFKAINEFQAQFAEENKNFELVLQHLIANIGVAVQTVATMKVASNNKLIEDSNRLLFTILKNSYNHYSPLLEHEEIEKIRNTNFNYSDTVEGYKPFQLKESSRVKYDILTGNWVAEDGTVTTMPFGISQIQEEIVAPIVQNLLEETRMERMKVYNDIKNQKINYLNKWHQDTEDFYGRNRTSSDDLLNIMRSNMTKFLASQATIESVAEIKASMHNQMLEGKRSETGEVESQKQDETALAAFEVQSQQFRKAQEDFDDYMERLKDDIDERARNFEYIEYYDASLRDRQAKDLVAASDNQDQLDARRRPLASINPLYAQASILPPSPSVDDVVQEQMSLNVAQYAASTLNEIGDGVPILQSVQPIAPHSSTVSPSDIPSTSPTETEEAHPLVDMEKPLTTSELENNYNLILKSVGDSKTEVVKILHDACGINTEDVETLIQSVPITLRNLSMSMAIGLKDALEEVGAEVEAQPIEL